MSAAKVLPVPVLSGAAMRHLRALGHPLEPVVRVGKEGLTPSLVEATKTALLRHELVKVKVQSEAPVDRREAASELAMATSSVLAQVLGRTFLLYRRHPKTPKIELPRPAKAGAAKAASKRAESRLPFRAPEAPVDAVDDSPDSPDEDAS